MTNTSQACCAKCGMTTTEFLVVICILYILIAVLCLFAPHNHRGSDRSANIMNIRNCQQAMRGEQNMRQLKAGEPFTREDLGKYMQYPTAVNSVIGYYRNAGDIRPESADPAVDWNHIWLIPASAAGLPGGEFGHNSYADVTGW